MADFVFAWGLTRNAQIMRGGVLVCTVQIYLLGGEQRAAQYMVEFLRGQVCMYVCLCVHACVRVCVRFPRDRK